MMRWLNNSSLDLFWEVVVWSSSFLDPSSSSSSFSLLNDSLSFSFLDGGGSFAISYETLDSIKDSLLLKFLHFFDFQFFRTPLFMKQKNDANNPTQLRYAILSFSLYIDLLYNYFISLIISLIISLPSSIFIIPISFQIFWDISFLYLFLTISVPLFCYFMKRKWEMIRWDYKMMRWNQPKTSISSFFLIVYKVSSLWMISHYFKWDGDIRW